jgi:glutamate-5-semialdehyde dehydrogenase
VEQQRLSPIRELAQRAKGAAARLQVLERVQKDAALRALAAGLRASVAELMAANELDLAAARSSGMADAMLDRLRLDAKTIEATARGVEHVVSLPDPVGSRGPMQRLPSGIRVGRQRLPLGVIAIIYESRPNVTIDAAALCLKSGNAALLRGGKEAAHSNRALGEVLRRAMESSGQPPDAVLIVPPGDRDGVRELVTLTGLVDLAIPRGGEGLIRFVVEHARVPVVQHFKGVCHLFLDQGSDAQMGTRLAVDGKVRKPGVCNALECLLVHAADAERLLPPVLAALAAEGVEIRGCERTRAIVPGIKLAAEDDFGAEFLAKIIAVRVVPDLDGALEHVRRYGSNHTDAICTDRVQSAERWLREVDSSCVLVNASTRFNDGGELGLGAEIGISTTKLHAYGPMGLESLTAEKWVVLGEGQVRG